MKFGEGTVFIGVYVHGGGGVGYLGHLKGHMVGYPSPRHETWIFCPSTPLSMGPGYPTPTPTPDMGPVFPNLTSDIWRHH